MCYTEEQVTKLHEFVKSSKSAAKKKRGLALSSLSKAKKRQDVDDVLDVNVATVDDWLELMYFSAYSPELNPQEWMWKEAKKAVCLNHVEEAFGELVYKFHRFLISHQHNPAFSQKVLGI